MRNLDGGRERCLAALEVKVIATECGLILMFESKEDLQLRIEHLQKHLEWIEQQNSNPPYFYAVYDDTIDRKRVAEVLAQFKNLVRVEG